MHTPHITPYQIKHDWPNLEQHVRSRVIILARWYHDEFGERPNYVVFTYRVEDGHVVSTGGAAI